MGEGLPLSFGLSLSGVGLRFLVLEDGLRFLSFELLLEKGLLDLLSSYLATRFLEGDLDGLATHTSEETARKVGTLQYYIVGLSIKQ